MNKETASRVHITIANGFPISSRGGQSNEKKLFDSVLALEYIIPTADNNDIRPGLMGALNSILQTTTMGPTSLASSNCIVLPVVLAFIEYKTSNPCNM